MLPLNTLYFFQPVNFLPLPTGKHYDKRHIKNSNPRQNDFGKLTTTSLLRIEVWGDNKHYQSQNLLDSTIKRTKFEQRWLIIFVCKLGCNTTLQDFSLSSLRKYPFESIPYQQLKTKRILHSGATHSYHSPRRLPSTQQPYPRMLT